MGSIRFIVFAIVIWLVWRMLQNFIAEKKSKKKKTDKISNELMVMCQHCSTHLPKNEALAHNESWFCNAEHKQLFLDDHKHKEQ